MLLLRAALLEFLVCYHVVGGAVLFRRLFPRESAWLAFIVPTLLVWAGFKQALIPYHRAPRHSGISKWPFWKRIKAAIDITVSFSYVPIRLMSVLGILASFAGFCR